MEALRRVRPFSSPCSESQWKTSPISISLADTLFHVLFKISPCSQARAEHCWRARVWVLYLITLYSSSCESQRCRARANVSIILLSVLSWPHLTRDTCGLPTVSEVRAHRHRGLHLRLALSLHGLIECQRGKWTEADPRSTSHSPLFLAHIDWLLCCSQWQNLKMQTLSCDEVTYFAYVWSF